MKKMLSILLSILMVIGVSSGVSLSAFAAGNSFSAATTATLGKNYSSTISSSNTSDYYKFTVKRPGTVTFTVNSYINQSLKLYDAKQNNLSSNSITNSNSSVAEKNVVTYNVVAGEYYAVFSCYYSDYGKYNFTITASAAGESFEDSQTSTNNSMQYASKIDLNTSYTAHIALNDKSDYFVFDLPSSGEINIVSNIAMNSKMYLYDSKGNQIYNTSLEKETVNPTDKISRAFDLVKGRYYLEYTRHSYYYEYGKINFTVNFTSANESFAETQESSNNSFEYASSIALGKRYYGQIAANDSCDYYKFSIPKNGKVTFDINTGYSGYVEIYDSAFEYVTRESIGGETNNEFDNLKFTKELNKGTYYLVFEQDYHSNTGNFNFAVSFSEIVNPPAMPSSLKVSSRGVNSLKLSWSKVSGATGYQLQRKSGNSYVTVATTASTSATVNNLKAGTAYSFKVRAYKTVNGKKYYSSWKTLTSPTKPSKVNLKSLSTNSNHEIIVKWSALSGGSGYQVQFAKDSNFKNVIATKTRSGIGTNKHVGKNFTKGKKYYVRVRAYKTCNGTKYYGAWSNAKSIKSK